MTGEPASRASLEGVTPSLTYYSGTSATGTALTGAPTTAGTYTVLASFAGSTDYTSGHRQHHVHDRPGRADGERDRRSGTYNGAAFAASDTVAGVTTTRGQPGKRDSEPDLLLGHQRTGTALSSAPTAVGTYTVLASFAGSTDYTSGSGQHHVHDQPRPRRP